jgi:hypothetical protein
MAKLDPLMKRKRKKLNNAAFDRVRSFDYRGLINPNANPNPSHNTNTSSRALTLATNKGDPNPSYIT